MNRLERLLPDGWQGRSRQARWSRSRARRALAALVAAGAVLVAWNALAPRATATRSITVAAHDLPAGHLITGTDLSTSQWPTSVQLPGAATASAAVGQVLTAPVSAGEPVTGSRVRAARSWPGASSGQVLVSVPVSDPAVAAITRPGDHVDVFAATMHGPVGSGLLVVSTHAGLSAPGRSSLVDAQSTQAASSLLLACSRTVATAIASAIQGSPTSPQPLVIALHPTP